MLYFIGFMLLTVILTIVFTVYVLTRGVRSDFMHKHLPVFMQYRNKHDDWVVIHHHKMYVLREYDYCTIVDDFGVSVHTPLCISDKKAEILAVEFAIQEIQYKGERDGQ